MKKVTVIMDAFEFTLIFRLPRHRGAQDAPDASCHLDALFEAGCDDALIGLGRAGYMALNFSREAADAEAAVNSASADVMAAIPGADLVEARPDLVGATEIATLTGCSRQNVRKHLVDKKNAPAPVYSGGATLWHLSDLVPWINKHTPLRIKGTVAETARVAFRTNMNIQSRRLDKTDCV